MNFLTTSEVAKRLGISRSRVYQLIKEGKLAASKIGRDYLVAETAIQNIKTYGKAGRPPKS